MTTKLEVIRAGVALDLSDDINYRHLQNDGFGIAPSHRFRDRGPQQHGSTDRGYLLDDRLIQLAIVARATDLDSLFDKRDELTEFFTPGNDTLLLRFTRPDGDIRQIDCFTEGAIPFTSNDIIGTHSQRVGVRLWCPDPAWYDPDGAGEVFALGIGGDLGEIPRVIPRLVGTSTMDASKTVVYAGTATVYPRLRITGPVTNCIITNTTIDEKLDFTGATIGAGDYYDIDLRYGKKTVTEDDGTNRIATLTNDSDLATFRIEKHPDAPNGENTFTVTGSAVTVATGVEMTWFVRYAGV